MTSARGDPSSVSGTIAPTNAVAFAIKEIFVPTAKSTTSERGIESWSGVRLDVEAVRILALEVLHHPGLSRASLLYWSSTNDELPSTSASNATRSTT